MCIKCMCASVHKTSWIFFKKGSTDPLTRVNAYTVQLHARSLYPCTGPDPCTRVQVHILVPVYRSGSLYPCTGPDSCTCVQVRILIPMYRSGSLYPCTGPDSCTCVQVQILVPVYRSGFLYLCTGPDSCTCVQVRILVPVYRSGSLYPCTAPDNVTILDRGDISSKVQSHHLKGMLTYLKMTHNTFFILVQSIDKSAKITINPNLKMKGLCVFWNRWKILLIIIFIESP